MSKKKVLNAGLKASKELRLYLAGELDLDPAEIEGRKILVKNASAESFYFFSKTVLGFSLLTSRTHKRWADELQAKWLECDFFARLKPRGTFKTTLYGEAFILWVWAVYSPQIRFFYTSANKTLLEEVSAHLDSFIDFDSESLYAFVFDIRRDKQARKNTNTIFNITGRDAGTKGSSLMFRTAGGSTNGVHPHFIIIDDPMDKADRESETVREKKKRWYDSLHPLLVPFRLKVDDKIYSIQKMMFIATRWHLDDLANHVRTKNNDWDFEVEGVYDDDGKPRYPEFFGEEEIDKKRRSIDRIFFACQYLNNPLPEGVQIFSLEQLSFMRPDQYETTQGSNFCFFDPSKGKKGSDYPAVIWVNLLNGRKVFFDAIDKRVELSALVKLIAERNKIHKTRMMVYETNGTSLVGEALEAAHKAIGYPMHIEGINETRNKYERIICMEPSLYDGSWHFRTDYETAYPELMNQLIFFPAWSHVDFPDIIEKAITYLTLFAPGSFQNYEGKSLSKQGGSLSGSLRTNKTW